MISIYEFCDTFPPSLDGVGRVVLRYCSQLNARGYQMTYCGPRARRPAGELPDRSILCRGIPMVVIPYKIALPYIDYNFHRQLAAGQPRLIHAHSPFSMGRAACQYAKKHSIPLIASYHTKYSYDMNRLLGSNSMYHGMMKSITQFYNQAQEVWCPNRSTAQYLVEQGYRGEPVIMEHGTDRVTVNAQMLEQQKQSRGFQADRLNLIYVGQIDKKKGLDRIFALCKQLTEYGVRYTLRMAGEGCDEAWAKNMVRQLEIEPNVSFLGFVLDRQELYALYQLSDLLVLPSVYDTFSIVLREAAMMGTPALIPAGSTISEAVTDTYNGLTYEDSGKAMADKVIRMMPELKQIGENAANTIPVSWDVVTDRVEERYRRIMEGKSS